jgi:hypothetical protein
VEGVVACLDLSEGWDRGCVREPGQPLRAREGRNFR